MCKSKTLPLTPNELGLLDLCQKIQQVTYMQDVPSGRPVDGEMRANQSKTWDAEYISG